jgi:tetratricopeptide (TPR) repeat protein
VHRRAGRYTEAHEAHSQALVIRERIGDPLGLGTTHNNLAQLHLARGDLGEAEAGYKAALDLWNSIGYASGVAIPRTGLGIAYVERGDYARAREHLTAALAEWEALGSRTYVSETQRYLAQAFVYNDHERAMDWAERAIATAREMNAADQEGIALRVKGMVWLARGESGEAIEALERSQQLLAGTTERQELGRTLAVLGAAYRALTLDNGFRAQAERLIAEARAIFLELGAKLDLARLEQASPSRNA